MHENEQRNQKNSQNAAQRAESRKPAHHFGGGRHGVFFKKEKQGYHIKSSAKQVFDVTGAGDTVIAAMAVCEAVGLEKEKACNIATLAAGLVVEKVGSATVTQEELIQRALTTKIQTEIW